MDNRLKSAIAVVFVHVVAGYALFTGLVASISQQAKEQLTLVNIAPDRGPPPKTPPLPLLVGQPVILQDWSKASPVQRNADFVKAFQWVKENLTTDEDRRFAKWRAQVPQGTGPGRVARLQPSNLTTHTLYWPANWSKGPLPIIAWGNGASGMCSNSSLPYAAFLAEIASHGYFVVAVGNDDIDYPQPEGVEILADGRPIRTEASALRKGIDWAIAENGRAGSPYQGKLDTSKIAYMGHSCGGQQAMTVSSDPRTTTTVVLNAAPSFRRDASETHKSSIAYFEGAKDDGALLDASDANFAKALAAGWPMYKAALSGMGHDGAYPGPDRRWSKAIVAWLDWQLKGDSQAVTVLNGLGRNGWNRIDAAGLASLTTKGGDGPAVGVN